MKRFGWLLLLCSIVTLLSARNIPQKDIQVEIGENVKFGEVNAKMVHFGGFTTPECKLAISNDGRYFYLTKVNSTCTKITNSKGVKIICNSDKSVCKTREELIKFVKRGLGSFSEQRNKFVSKEDERKHYSKFEKWLYNNCFLENNKEKSAIWSTSYCQCYVKAIIEVYKDANGYNKYFANLNKIKYKKRANELFDHAYFCFISADTEEYEITHPKESKEIDRTLSALSQSSNNSLKSQYSQPSWCNSSYLNKTEHTICASDTLSALDMNLAKAYGTSKAHSKDIEQRAWLKKRNQCGYDVQCIKNLYEDRLEELVKLKSKSVNKEKKYKEEPLLEIPPLKEQRDTLGIKGDYLGTSGCQDSHGYGMAEDAWKIIQSDGKYYTIDFDIACGEGVEPNFITTGAGFINDEMILDIQDISIEEKHQFKVKGYGDDLYSKRGNDIVFFFDQDKIEKYKKYLAKLQSKKNLSKKEQKNIKILKRMLDPNGYAPLSKSTDIKYQKVFDNAPTYAMMQAIRDKDIKSVKILLRSQEKINECVPDSNLVKPNKPVYYTPYMVIEENISKVLQIYNLFKVYDQTETCYTKEYFKDLISSDFDMLKYMDDNLKKDKTLAFELVLKNEKALSYFDESIRDDKAFALKIFNDNTKWIMSYDVIYKSLTPRLQKDKDIIACMIKKGKSEYIHIKPKLSAMDKQVLNNVKKSMHYILDRNIKAFANITDSGRVYTRKNVEKLIGSETSWKKNFPFLDGITHTDIDTLQIYKKADRDKERTCRYMATGKEVPCKSLEYCFVMEYKTLPNEGCLDMYYIGGRMYWEPFGW